MTSQAGDALAGFVLRADAVTATRQQLELFAEAPRRDLSVANRALARLRAEFGDEVVVRAVLRAAHLPEARARFDAEVLAHVVVVAIPVVFAIGQIVFLPVTDQVVQRKTIVGGYEVDTAIGRSSAWLIQVR